MGFWVFFCVLKKNLEGMIILGSSLEFIHLVFFIYEFIVLLRNKQFVQKIGPNRRNKIIC